MMMTYPPNIASFPDGHPLKRRWIAAGSPTPTPPPPTAEERLDTLLAALADAQTLGDVRDAAAAAGGA
jgi:hypothetical protein